ncbi:MAG: hypothetical protein QXQ02_04710 [Halobacteria archaeon]
MPTYDCNEHQFVENLRRATDSNIHVIVNRMVTKKDDGKYGLSNLPDQEFKKYEVLATRRQQRATVYAKVPFYDELHRRLYLQNDILHSATNPHKFRLSIPYVNVEYRFTLWGETYRHEFDVLFEPHIRLDRPNLPQSLGERLLAVFFDSKAPLSRSTKRATLMYVLNFIPPPERMLDIHLPPSTIVFDVSRLNRP